MSQQTSELRGPKQLLGITPEKPIPVGRATRRLRELIGSAVGQSLWVCGELTDLRRDAAGNIRFALEDGTSRVACVVWSRNTLRDAALLEDGMRLTVLARLGLYERDARIQATVTAVQLDGDGAAKRQLERTRERLRSDGLLDPRRKRRLPPHPSGVAVITSRTGAALHDILAVARRRHPGVPIFVAPTVVQGSEAAASVIRALGLAQRSENCDVAIIARGGGSPADLAIFNDEGLARAVAACRIPVVTAIGHETDVSIADEVADLCVGTPSIAAERAIPDRRVLARSLAHTCERMRSTLDARVNRMTAKLDVTRAGLARAVAGRMQRERMRFDRAREKLSRCTIRRVRRSESALRRQAEDLERLTTRRVVGERARLSQLSGALSELDPTRVLGRGYAILSDEQGRVLSSVTEASEASRLTIQMHDGELMVHVAAKI